MYKIIMNYEWQIVNYFFFSEINHILTSHTLFFCFKGMRQLTIYFSTILYSIP